MSSLPTLIDGLDAPWGHYARTQGLVIVLNGDLSDDGAGHIGLPSLRITNPLSGTYIDVNAGSFTLGLRDALVVDLPPTSAERAAVNARVVTWVDATRRYDNRDSIVLGVRTSGGLWQWRAGAGGSRVMRIPIELRNARTTAGSPGASFPQVAVLTSFEFWHWEFVKDVDGYVDGIVTVPMNVSATPIAKVVLALAANATSGVTRFQVWAKRLADGGSVNYGSWDTNLALDVSVPGTAYNLKHVSFDLSAGIVPAAGEIVVITVGHIGTHANDTLAVNSLLMAAWLELKQTF